MIADGFVQPGVKCFLLTMKQRFQVTIEEVHDQSLRVTFPAGDYPIDGMGAMLEFHKEDEVVFFNTVVSRGPRKVGDGVVLARSESANRRKHRRSWRVPWNVSTTVEEIATQREYDVNLQDISRGGLLMRSDAPLAFQANLRIRLAFPDEPPYVVEGRVAYAEEAGTVDGGPRARFGVKFTNLPKPAENALVVFLWERVRQIYPEQISELYPRTQRRHTIPVWNVKRG